MAKKTKSRKTSAKKKVSRKKTASRKAASKAPARKKRAARKPQNPMAGMNGWITHTEFASSNPEALKNWCKGVLGWKIKPGVTMSDGSEYILFTYADTGGGGIRPTGPGEPEGTTPYVQVADVHKTFEKALSQGATQMIPPTRIMPDLVIAVVRAPGGVTIGFAGPK